jgi:polyisoprenoid-binding protein YceI
MSRVLVLLSAFASACLADVMKLNIDTAHSAAMFSVRHLMVSNVKGQMGPVRGSVEYDPADPSKTVINATIDVTAINTREPKRDAHLKSDDFFAVDKYPTITFVSKRAEGAGSGRLKITGDLTIRGVTKEVVLDVEPSAPIKQGNGSRIGATATTRINRKDFGVSWGGVRDNVVVVADEVLVTIDAELVTAR